MFTFFTCKNIENERIVLQKLKIFYFFCFFLLWYQKKLYFCIAKQRGTIAQLVEQRTENPCVAGSTPAGTTNANRTIG